MTSNSLLEKFEVNGRSGEDTASSVVQLDVERIKSEAFEAGYTSGWDDAKNSDSETYNRVDAEFERNIQNLMFTYTEAVECIRSELRSFVNEIINTFLPSIVSELTKAHIENELIKISDEITSPEIEILAAPDIIDILDDLLDKEFLHTIKITSDITLASKQAYIRLSSREIDVNILPLVESLRAQLTALTTQVSECDINAR